MPCATAATCHGALAAKARLMTWILLRGLAREARHWGSFAQQFSRVLASSNLIHQAEALDLPGNGEFCQLPSPTSVPRMVELARQQFDQFTDSPATRPTTTNTTWRIGAVFGNTHQLARPARYGNSGQQPGFPAAQHHCFVIARCCRLPGINW